MQEQPSERWAGFLKSPPTRHPEIFLHRYQLLQCYHKWAQPCACFPTITYVLFRTNVGIRELGREHRSMKLLTRTRPASDGTSL